MLVKMQLDSYVSIFWIWNVLYFQLQECCRFGQGSNCGFPCRCTGDNICDPETGACLGGSQCQSVLPDGYGWQGLGCRIGNVAYAKTNASQSGSYLHYTAGLAVDGDTTPYITNALGESCAHPFGRSESFAWWWVDLEDIFTIKSITIINRLSLHGLELNDRFLARSTGYDIKIGIASDRAQLTLCFHQGKPADQVLHIETVTCESGDMVGRYVSFTRTGGLDPNQAAICEFIVMGHRTIECHPADCLGECDSMLGCEKCVAGKMLPECKIECPDGYWGESCGNRCGMCEDGVVCGKVTGSCGSQCDSWYIPQLCTELLGQPPLISSVTISDITSDSVILFWDRSTEFDASIQKYFYYTVQYRSKYDNTADWYTSNRVPLSNQIPYQHELSGLEHNTEFVVHIVPHRGLNGLTETGTIKAKEFKTMCKAPAIPSTPSIYGTPERFTVTWDPITSISFGCDTMSSAVLIITCDNSTHTVLNEIYDILIANRTLTFETKNVLSCSVVLFVTNNAGLSSASAITSVLTSAIPFTLANLPTTVTAAEQQQTIDSGPNITAIIVGSVLGLVVIVLVVVIVVRALRNRRNMPSPSGSQPDTCTPGLEKTNPVYENTTGGDNDDMQTTRGVFKQGERSMTPNMVKESEQQYAALDKTHQTTAKPSPLYQELK